MTSDNGPPFQNEEFANFCKNRNICHITSPPHHPASNGLAERAVQTTKAVLNKLMEERGLLTNLQIDELVKSFLHHHHQTPSSEEGIIPYEKMLKYRPRTD